MIKKLVFSFIITLCFINPTKSLASGGSPIILIGPILVATIPAISSHYAEKSSGRDSDDYWTYFRSNYVISSFTGFIVFSELGDIKTLKEFARGSGILTALLSPFLYSNLLNHKDFHLELFIPFGSYGTNSLGLGLETTYLNLNLAIGYGSFGDENVAAVTNSTKFITFKYDYKLSENNHFFPEIAFSVLGSSPSIDGSVKKRNHS